jgi:chaperonin GroEL (HSP60 family)
MHAARHLIASGGVPGGGAAYLHSATALAVDGSNPAEAAAARSLAEGLAAPARCLLKRAGRDPESDLRAIQARPELCFDAESKGLVVWRREGPLDNTRTVQAAITLAAATAASLLEAVEG